MKSSLSNIYSIVSTVVIFMCLELKLLVSLSEEKNQMSKSLLITPQGHPLLRFKGSVLLLPGQANPSTS